MTTVFKILAQKYPNNSFLVPNLGIFALSQNFAIRQIRGRSIEISQYYFQIPHQSYQTQIFLVPYLKIFIFAPKIAMRQNKKSF